MKRTFATMAFESDPTSTGSGSAPGNPIVGHPMPDGEPGDDSTSAPADD